MLTLRPGVLLLCVWGASGLFLRADPPDGNGSAPTISDERFAILRTATAISPDDELELALGLDERREREQAAVHYRRAAAAGIGVAELRLGALAEVGDGVLQSYEAAAAHYQRAISLGVPEANLRLGMLHLEGWGVPADPSAAVAHIQRAAEADYAPAQKILSDIYFAGLKVARDLPRALSWAERAAAHRDPSALARVGGIRQRAAKLPQDLILAREWYQLSAEQDYTRGMVAMASTFLGRGASRDDVKLGLRWLELAANGGNTTAAFHLAGFHLFAANDVSDQASDLARARLQQAAAGGENQAAEVLELEKAGQPLREAFQHVVSVPFEDRHVQRLAADPRFAEDAQGNQLPRPLKLVSPIYPAALRLADTEGEVVVEFVIDTTGRVRNPRIVSTTHPGFSSSALASFSAARFQPAKRAGRFVNVRVQQPVFYKLTDLHTPASRAQDRAIGLVP